MLHAWLRTDAGGTACAACAGCFGLSWQGTARKSRGCMPCTVPPRCGAGDPPSRAASVQATPLATERPALCMQVEETVALGAWHVRLRSVPRHHRNTLLHTGLMLWDSGPVLARLLLACPALTAGQGPLPQLLCADTAPASTPAAADSTAAGTSLTSSSPVVELCLPVPARHAWHPDSCI